MNITMKYSFSTSIAKWEDTGLLGSGLSLFTERAEQIYTAVFVILSIAAWVFFAWSVARSYAKPTNDDIFGHSLDWIFHALFAIELLAGQLGLYYSATHLLFESDDGMEPGFGKVIILIGSVLLLLFWLLNVLQY